MLSEHLILGLSWASWSSIFAGGVTALAISVVMAVLGVALGFTVVEPKSEEPTSGLVTAFGIWSVISVLVSLAAGGFVAGLFAGQRGLEHGFLVWAIVVIAASIFGGVAIGMAVKTLGTAVRGLGHGAAEVASTLGKGAGQAAAHVVNDLKQNVRLNLDTEKLDAQVCAILRDTGVDTLQPEYLREQMREAKSDLRKALHDLALEPHSHELIINGFLESQKNRLESLSKAIDRDAAAEALSAHRNLPREEAEKMVDNAVNAYHEAVKKAEDSLAEAKSEIQDAKLYLKNIARQARDKADKLSKAAAKAALAAAVALILAALISMGAGYCGAKYSAQWAAYENIYLIP